MANSTAKKIIDAKNALSKIGSILSPEDRKQRSQSLKSRLSQVESLLFTRKNQGFRDSILYNRRKSVSGNITTEILLSHAKAQSERGIFWFSIENLDLKRFIFYI